VSRARACAVLAAAASTVIGVRPAWPCGGGFGGVSFGGGGDDDKCEPDPDEVHGRRSCGGYGSWGKRRGAHVFEVMSITSYVDVSDVEASGQIEHEGGARYSYRVVNEELGGDDGPVGTAGLAFRYLFHGPVLYVGAEVGVAYLNPDEIDHMIDPATGSTLTPRIESMVTAGAVLGARTFLTPFGDGLPLSIGAEVAGGARGIVVDAESRHGSCVANDTTTHTTPMVELRARADVWVSPRVALGAYAGADAITGLPSGGMILSTHWRAFDGMR